MTEVTLEAIRAARDRIRPSARQTPVITSRGLNERAGVEIFLKCENLQRTGSFKMRGATNFIRSLSAEALPKGVVAFSSGNHGQAVAAAAREAGIPATIVMPEDAPKAKVQATRDQGATIIHYNRFKDDREAIGRAIAAESGATLAPPYDHPWIVIGQGTAGLELMEQVPDLDAIVVCTGGGGLLAGCSVAAKGINPNIRMFGSEPELANDWALSMAKGEPVTVDPSRTIADGLRTPTPGKVTFPIVKRLVEGILLVTEDEIKEMVRYLATRVKILAEPSGVVATAAVVAKRLPPGIRKVGVTISGGNIDWDVLIDL